MISKRKNKIAGALAVFLIICLTVIPPTTFAEDTTTDAPATATTAMSSSGAGKKEEVVYANLSSSGEIGEIYIVNHLDGKTAVDYGNYSAVANLSDTEALRINGDSVAIPEEETDFYYQGTLIEKNLPWDFSIFYYLDGNKIEPEDLAGKSGALEIRISTRKNDSVNDVFYDNYMLQMSLTLDAEKCADIISEGATIASAGKSKVIAHTVMPGKDADISLTANVVDFSMPGIEIAGMPFSMSIDIPDTDEMLGEMDTFSGAINSFKNGVGSLSDGSQTFSDGLLTLSGNAGPLVDGSAQINGGLSQMAASLSGVDGSDLDLSALASLPANLRQIAGGIGQTATGLTGMESSLSTIRSGLSNAILAIPNTAISSAEIDAMAASLSTEQQQTLATLYQGYSAAQATKSACSGIGSGIESIEQGLGQMSGSLDTIVQNLNTMADGIDAALSGSDLMEGIDKLKTGLTQLSQQYEEFHTGLSAFMGGVQLSSAGYTELNDGIKELYSGAVEMNGAVANLPETIQEEIDKLLGDYDKSDFVPISFVSDKNRDVSSVQFVIMTSAIEKDPVENGATEQETTASFWDRIAGLFS